MSGPTPRVTSAEFASGAQAWRAPDIEGTAFGSRHRRDIFGDTPEQADAAFERLRAEAYELGMASAKIELDRFGARPDNRVDPPYILGIPGGAG